MSRSAVGLLICSHRARGVMGARISWVVLLAWCVLPAPVAAQSRDPDRSPARQGSWAAIAGGGGAVSIAHSLAGREMAFQSIEWTRVLTDPHGPGPLTGRLEMGVAVTPVFLAFQHHRATGAGLSPLLLRWSFTRRTTIEPFVDIAAGVMLTNQQVPEQTTKFNFTAHAGGGARIRIADRWGVIVGYRFHHLSNANTAPRNPAINSNVGYAGLTFGQR